MTAKGIRKRYQREQSKLFNCKSKSKLADLLKVELLQLKELRDKGSANYKQFKQIKAGKKERRIQNPKPPLKRIQRRIAKLTARIETPDYLHSAIKMRSYVSNATAHPCGIAILKVDIKAFFESAQREKVYQFFLKHMQCSQDVSALLADLTTINSHLPTGAPTSQILSFYAYKQMFDELNQMALTEGLKMTLYVDDLTFSGEAANNRFKEKVRRTIRKYGLQVSVKKCRVSRASETKIVTGVALTNAGIKLPNRRQLAIHQARLEIGQETIPSVKIQKMKSLQMRLYEASQIEPRFKEEGERLRQRIAAHKKVFSTY